MLRTGHAQATVDGTVRNPAGIEEASVGERNTMDEERSDLVQLHDGLQAANPAVEDGTGQGLPGTSGGPQETAPAENETGGGIPVLGGEMGENVETRGIKARVSEMWDATRWRMTETAQGGQIFWYRDSDGMERARYRTQPSRLMEEIEKNKRAKKGKPVTNRNLMLGLYAMRRFEVHEPIAVYIGEDIGEQGGDGDAELERRAAENGGRHVMQQGRRLVDGKYGPTGAQYVNSAYRAPKGWANNARILATGTIVATKVIRPGTEILMAYGNAYWRRWGVEESLETETQPPTSVTTAGPASSGQRRRRREPTVEEGATGVQQGLQRSRRCMTAPGASTSREMEAAETVRSATESGGDVSGAARMVVGVGDDTTTTTTTTSSQRRRRRRERLVDEEDDEGLRRVTRRMTQVQHVHAERDETGIG